MWVSRVTWQMVAWIGSGGKMTWPLRSPDLTLLDFTVWGYVKDKHFVPLLTVNICRQDLNIYCICCAPGENHLKMQ